MVNNPNLYASDIIPENILRQLASCQTAANEFLRQYWLSVFPSPQDSAGLSSTAASRAAKASKMIMYLTTTHERVDAIVKDAVNGGLDVIVLENVSIYKMVPKRT